MVAFLISQQGALEKALVMIRGALREHGKLIVNLSVAGVCEMIRMKDGPTLGNPRLHVARRSAMEAVTAEADRFAANVLPIIREAQKAGATSLREIAAALNARGVATARGAQWHAKSVSNILERA